MTASSQKEETSRHRHLELEPTPVACRIGGRTFQFISYAKASAAYLAACDATNAYGSNEVLSYRKDGIVAPPCEIIDANGNCLAFISYNGKVWKGPLDNNNYDCLYNPYPDEYDNYDCPFNPYALAGKAVEIDWRQV